MDLLFKKYANPFLFLDSLIQNGDFTDWLIEFVNAENDLQLWDVWLHKVFDNTSFEKFKESVLHSQPKVNEEVRLEETVKNSKLILINFKPT